ncbi:MAG TPA: CoA transferase [Chthoniobacteraceae bacterium]|nr:CoA transferase [Chthoniobacteraceae bacterium]
MRNQDTIWLLGSIAFDPVAQGLCGLMSVTGKSIEEGGGGPVKAGPSLIDIITGLYAVISILAAVRQRELTGKGSDIDLSLLDCGVTIMAQHFMHYFLTGTVPNPIGNGANGGVPGGGYQCADGMIMIAPGNDAGYARMCYALGRPDLATDPRFVANQSRLAHKTELLAILEPIYTSWKVADLVAELVKHDVPCGPVNNVAEAAVDPQILSRGLMTAVATGRGPIRQVAGPIVINGSRMTSPLSPPALGDSDGQISW